MRTVDSENKLDLLGELFNVGEFKTLTTEMSFAEYLDLVYKQPKLIRTAYQRLYDMILSEGSEAYKRYRKTHTRYNFFDGKGTGIPIFGLQPTLGSVVKFIRGAAGGYGTEKRVMLLHGPVGSSKSTICRAIKKGMENYSRTEDGAWYTYKWTNLPTGPDGIYTQDTDECPMNEDPIKLIPENIRRKVVSDLNEIWLDSFPEGEARVTAYRLRCDGELNPRCRLFMAKLLAQYEGDWKKVVENHITVVRKVYSESDRCGIATFQPKDEKNQDATELTGDINYAKMPHFGSDSDPRAFNFDGEFCVGNRGVVEFIEVLKLAKEFLYDLLGASQERNIKPKKFAQIGIDLVLIGHTNNPEFEKLKNDTTMEALRDRTVKIDVPYLLEMSEEIKVLKQDYNPEKVKQHIAPHTIEIAGLWAVLTRLKDDRENNITLVDKAKLYDGKFLPGWTEDRVKEMRDKYDEGFQGLSARYVQDKISNCLSSRHDYINPFIVMNELRDGLSDNSLITNKDEVNRYMTCIEMAQKELDEILKNEVQKALVGDEEAIQRLCANYLDNLLAYINKSKINNPYTGKEQDPDERLMRSIEEKAEISETTADDFRRMVAAGIGSLAHQGKKFTWDSNPKLKKALEAKLFEDTKDHIKLSALNTSGAAVVDKDLQEKIDSIKQRLIRNHGYNEKSATDVLDYVGSIFARGEISDD